MHLYNKFRFMLNFNYKNIIVVMAYASAITIILFLLFPHRDNILPFIVSLIFPLFVYFKYANRIDVRKTELIIRRPLRRQEIINYDNVKNIAVLKDPFFFSKTIKLIINTDGGRKCVCLGTLPSSQINNLISLLGNKVKLLF